MCCTGDNLAVSQISRQGFTETGDVVSGLWSYHDRSLSEAARSSELNEAEVVEAGALRTES
jgi:hypothetical protein